MDLNEIADQLYGLLPDQFMAARTEAAAQARTAKDRDLAKSVNALRRPSLSAWLVNQLVRRQPDGLSELRGIGDRLRAAQAAGSGAEMRELGHERTRVVDHLAAAAGVLAVAEGMAVSAGTDREVRETLTASLASAQAAAAVSTGQLTRSLSYSGLGDVDLTAAVATPASPVHPPLARAVSRVSGLSDAAPDDAAAAGRAERARARRSRAEKAALSAAEDALRAATDRADATSEALLSATHDRDAAHDEVDQLRRRLEESLRDLAGLESAVEEADKAWHEAQDHQASALLVLDQTRARADDAGP